MQCAATQGYAGKSFVSIFDSLDNSYTNIECHPAREGSTHTLTHSPPCFFGAVTIIASLVKKANAGPQATQLSC